MTKPRTFLTNTYNPNPTNIAPTITQDPRGRQSPCPAISNTITPIVCLYHGLYHPLYYPVNIGRIEPNLWPIIHYCLWANHTIISTLTAKISNRYINDTNNRYTSTTQKVIIHSKSPIYMASSSPSRYSTGRSDQWYPDQLQILPSKQPHDNPNTRYNHCKLPNNGANRRYQDLAIDKAPRRFAQVRKRTNAVPLLEKRFAKDVFQERKRIAVTLRFSYLFY